MANDLAPLDSLAERINAEHAACESALRSGVAHALEAGRLLLEVKDRVEHGQWLPWVRENCQCSERTAQGYMKLARHVAGLDAPNAKRVADLPYREALALIAEPRAIEGPVVEVGPTGPDTDEPPGILATEFQDEPAEAPAVPPVVEVFRLAPAPEPEPERVEGAVVLKELDTQASAAIRRLEGQGGAEECRDEADDDEPDDQVSINGRSPEDTVGFCFPDTYQWLTSIDQAGGIGVILEGTTLKAQQRLVDELSRLHQAIGSTLEAAKFNLKMTRELSPKRKKVRA